MSSYNEWYYDEEPTLTDVGIREVDYDPLSYAGYGQRPVRNLTTWRRQSCLFMVVLIIFVVTGFAGTLGVRALFQGDDTVHYQVVPNETATSTLSPIFTDEVLYWENDILRWAADYNLDPNLIATVMQIESCGDPQAGSSAGAQGLFQVMPFHFSEGESMLDTNTNARRGLNYLVEGLKKSEGHVGLALAGYNGGHGMIGWGWARWPNETRRYHYWGTGIYYDAVSGGASSDRLNEWLTAGGAHLCAQAAAVQETLPRSLNAPNQPVTR